MLLFGWLACAEPQAPVEAPPPAAEAAALPPHQTFPSAEAALVHLLEARPRVIGIGEVHATTEGPQGPSTLSRFTERLLPVLAPTTTDLVIETWRMASACGEVAEKVVTAVETDTKRPEATKSEIELLAEKAVVLGVRPHDLAITCDEYPPLLGEDGQIVYDRLLALLTLKLGDFATRGLDTADARVVLYGGAVHNDVAPMEGLESYSYGRAAREKGGESYLELDLYAPELIRGSELLLEPAWAPLLDGATGPDRVVLYRRGPGSVVLLLEELGPR